MKLFWGPLHDVIAHYRTMDPWCGLESSILDVTTQYGEHHIKHKDSISDTGPLWDSWQHAEPEDLLFRLDDFMEPDFEPSPCRQFCIAPQMIQRKHI
jgi:hypothetical protein